MGRRFKSLRSELPLPCYDAVIIGAGVGGLVCANLLARSGLQVLLVEQHYMVGGYCSTFKRKGFVFDAATHFYPLLGNPATLTGRQLVDLGVRTNWVKMDPVDQFHFPDGSKFSVPADFDTYVAAVRKEFPDEREALDQFFALARRVYLLGLLHHFRGKPTPQIEPYAKLSVQDVLDKYFRNTKLKLLLTADTGHWGSPPERTSFVFDSMLRFAYFLGNYYPRGSSQAFADDLAARFEENGGHILMSSLVSSIHISNGAANGVDVETGTKHARKQIRVRAGVVVSNADLLLTLEKMVGREWVDPDYLACIKKLRPSLPCSVTHVGLRGVPVEVLEAVQGYHWSSWNPNHVGTAAFKIFVPTLFDSTVAPPGGHIVIVQKLTPVDFEGVSDWVAEKTNIEASVRVSLERVLPGVSTHIAVLLTASALTSYRYTLNRHGSMLGWELAPDQVGVARPDVNGLVKNLYFVGHWTRPGGGITPVMMSAKQVAQLILRDHEDQRLAAPQWMPLPMRDSTLSAVD